MPLFEGSVCQGGVLLVRAHAVALRVDPCGIDAELQEGLLELGPGTTAAFRLQ